MADPSTTNYGWVKPTVGSDADSWGGILNGDLDGIDEVVGNIASIIAIAGSELINLSGSVTGISSSLGGVSTSQVGVSGSLAGAATSLSGLSASMAVNAAGVAAASSSVAAVDAALGAASVSLGQVSSSLGATSAAVLVASSSLAGVSSSLVGVATSLGSAVSGTGPGALGFLGIPQSIKSASYTLTAADVGTELFFTASATLTLPSNAALALPVGSFVKASAANGVSLTVAVNSDTLVDLATGGGGARTVTGRGYLLASKEKTTEWWASGANVS